MVMVVKCPFCLCCACSGLAWQQVQDEAGNGPQLRSLPRRLEGECAAAASGTKSLSLGPPQACLMVHVAFLGTHSRPLSTRPFSDKKDAPDPQFVASDKPRAEWVQPTGRGEGTPSLVGDVWARIWGTGKISEAVTPAPGPLRPTGDGWELRSARAHTPQHLHVPLPTHACEKGFHQITKCAHPFPLGPQCITHGIRRYHGGIPTSRRDQTDRLAAGRPGLYSELLSQMTECWCLVRCNVVELLSK